MYVTGRLSRLILGICVLSCALITYTVVSSMHIHLPQQLWQRQLTDVQVSMFASKQKIKPEVGQLVIFRQKGSWAFGVVSRQTPDQYYDIVTQDNGVVYQDVASSSIKTLSFTWRKLFNPTISLEGMRHLLDERADY